ncbi:trypsin-like serine peptidase [Streptomyces sp. BI20]|uniref:trypsin-like serine peptidase n=1 Tax=Streptomyces sp. BI20 TaxID=3403460 RepID=UPI003C74560C
MTWKGAALAVLLFAVAIVTSGFVTSALENGRSEKLAGATPAAPEAAAPRPHGGADPLSAPTHTALGSPSPATPSPRPSSSEPSSSPPGPSASGSDTRNTRPEAARFAGPLFEGPLADGHFCTATVVHSPGGNLIATAGHCLSDGAPTEGRGAVFAPGFTDGKAPYGTWRITEVFQDSRWADSQDDAYDLAFARLAPDASGRSVESVVGAAGLDTAGRVGEPITVTGYPSDRDRPRVCAGPAVRTSATEQRFDCADFPGGTSGSAWIAADGAVVGVLTGGDTDDVSTSTVFGDWTADLYRRATAGR